MHILKAGTTRLFYFDLFFRDFSIICFIFDK